MIEHPGVMSLRFRPAIALLLLSLVACETVEPLEKDGSGWVIGFDGADDAVFLRALPDGDVVALVESASASRIQAGAELIEGSAQGGCLALRFDGISGALRWQTWFGRDDEEPIFCTPGNVVGDALVIVPTVFPPARLVAADGELVALELTEAAVVAIGLDDGATTLKDVLPNTEGGAVVRTLDGIDVALRLETGGAVVVDFLSQPPASVRFENMGFPSTVIGFALAALDGDVIVTTTLSDEGLPGPTIPWDDGTQTSMPPRVASAHNAFIARVGPGGTRWALHGEASESAVSIDASGLAFGAAANGRLIKTRTGAEAAKFSGGASEGFLLEVAADGEIAKLLELASLPACLARGDEDELWLLGETVPVPGRHTIERVGFSRQTASFEFSDVVLASRRGSVTFVDGAPIFGVRLANAADASSLVADSVNDTTVVILRPDAAALPDG